MENWCYARSVEVDALCFFSFYNVSFNDCVYVAPLSYSAPVHTQKNMGIHQSQYVLIGSGLSAKTAALYSIETSVVLASSRPAQRCSKAAPIYCNLPTEALRC